MAINEVETNSSRATDVLQVYVKVGGNDVRITITPHTLSRGMGWETTGKTISDA